MRRTVSLDSKSADHLNYFAIGNRKWFNGEEFTYVLLVFEENFEVHVIAEDHMRGKSLQKNLVHRNRFLERGKVLLL